MRALQNMKWIAMTSVVALGLSGCGNAGPGITGIGGLLNGLVAEGLSPELAQLAVDDCAALNKAAKDAGDEFVCKPEASCPADDENCVNIKEIAEAGSLNNHAKFPATLALGFKQIKNEKPDKAKASLKDKVAAENPAETYAYVIASLKSGVDSIAGLLNTIAAQLAPGTVLPAQGTDFKSIVQSVLNPIIENLELIAATVPVIRTADNAYLNIPSVPLGLDPSVLDSTLPKDIALDLGGGYDRFELLVLGAASEGIAGGIEFILAHKIKLKLDTINLFDKITSSNIAQFIVENGELLALDNAAGIGTAKDRFIRALDLAVGKEGGAPGADGLLAAVEAELASGNQDGDILVFGDTNGDGKASAGDTLTLTFVKDIINDFDQLSPGDELITVSVDRPAWVGLIELGREIQANLEGTGGSVGLTKHLDDKDNGGKIWDYLQDQVSKDLADNTVLADFDFTDAGKLPDLKDWLYINPKKYFDNPIAVRNLLPAITKTDTNKDPYYEIALECELGFLSFDWANPTPDGSKTGIDADSVTRGLCGPDTTSKAMTAKQIYFGDSTNATDATVLPAAQGGGGAITDFAHFKWLVFDSDPKNQAAPVGITGDALVKHQEWFTIAFSSSPFAKDLGTTDLTVNPDGYAAATNTTQSFDDVLLSVLMQTASLGGTLEIDLVGDPADSINAIEASNDSLNAMIAQGTYFFGPHVEALIDGLSSTN